MSRKTRPFTLRINELITDPSFHRLASISAEPNFFNIVGQSRYERWHSAFWGWLLDPNGSHRLGDFALSRLLVLLFSDSVLPASTATTHANDLLTRTAIQGVTVRPNENDHAEVTVVPGRLDILVAGHLTHGDGSRRDLNMIIEMKVESRIRRDQALAYADWLVTSHPNDLNLLVYILPSEERRSTSEATVGDPRWYCVEFQQLHDNILLPVLDHHALNSVVKPLIVQYVANLRTPFRGIKMAITAEERKLARELYERYMDVFDGLAQALQAEGVDYELEEPAALLQGRVYGRLAVEIEGHPFEGNTVVELLRNCLEYLVDSGAVSRMALPWGTGTKRYIIARGPNPQHPNGRDFFVPIEYKGFVLEGHMERARSFKILADLCEHLELKFAPVET